jgi:hypothetical protein
VLLHGSVRVRAELHVLRADAMRAFVGATVKRVGDDT